MQWLPKHTRKRRYTAAILPAIPIVCLPFRMDQGNSTSYSDCLYTISGNKIYSGNSTSYSDCLYTLSGAKIYKANSTSYSDCLFTLDSNKVYQGNSTSYSDCLISVDGIFKLSMVAWLIGPY